MYFYAESIKGGKVILKVINLRRISEEDARRKFGSLIGPEILQPDPTAGVLIGDLIILGEYDPNAQRLVPIRTPIKVHASLYVLSVEKCKKIWKFEGEVHLGDVELGIYADLNEKEIKPIELAFRMNDNELINGNIFVCGSEKFGKTLFTVFLISKLFQSNPNKFNIIIFDYRGEYVNFFKTFYPEIFESIITISGNLVLRNLNKGFGFEYKTAREILAFISTLPEYNIYINLLKKALTKIEKSGQPFTIEKIEKIAREIYNSQQFPNINLDEFLTDIKALWLDNLGYMLKAGTIVIIDISRNMPIRAKIQLISGFLRELFYELTLRIHREKNVSRMIVMENIDLFAPKKGLESSEGVDIAREHILNIMAHSELFNAGILGITSAPSKVSPLVFYFSRTKFICRLTDPMELETISSFLKVPSEILENLEFGEFIVVSSRTPKGIKIKTPLMKNYKGELR